ncbi:MAG: tetratricopeptide repeat protein [Bacteroidetes bacterium]|nr:MAG: tetratricopeptide repeat protein [Bacteroidota bacterium]
MRVQIAKQHILAYTVCIKWVLLSCLFSLKVRAQNNTLHFNTINLKNPAYISTPHHPVLDLENATFEMWVYWQGTDNISTLFMKTGNASISNYGWGLGINQKGYLEWWQQFLQGEGPKSTSNPIPIHKWTHIAVTVAGNRAIKFYVNGVLSGTSTAKMMNGNGNLIVGKQGEHGNHFRGIMDDFRIWNEALTPQQIKTMMHKAPTGAERNLVLCYDFNQNNATNHNIISDLAKRFGGANDGVLKEGEHTLYENKGAFEASLKYHFQALHFKERIDNQGELARLQLNLGVTHYLNGQMKESLTAYQKALDVNQHLPTPNNGLNAQIYYYLSNTHRRLKQYDKAEEYAQKALTLAEQIKDKIILVDATNGLGTIATEQKQYTKAHTYYEKSCELASQAQDWLMLANTWQYLADSYRQEGLYEKAIIFALQSLQLAQKQTLKAEEKNACLLLASLYSRQGRFEEAYQYEQRHNVLKDTLAEIQNKQQMTELRIEYETEKKTQQIQLLEKDQLLKEYAIYGLSFVLCLLIAVAIYRYQMQKKLHKEQQEAILTKLEMQKIQNTAELVLQEMENKIVQERYEEQIAHQERELASNTMHLFQKNEMLNTLQEKLNELAPEVKAQVKPLLQDVRNTIDLDKDWENFQRHFTEVHPKFFTKLLENFPTLSQTELKLLAYIRMKLSNKEMASLMNVATKSVEMSRYRLKKKFNLGAEESLDRWVESY